MTDVLVSVIAVFATLTAAATRDSRITASIRTMGPARNCIDLKAVRSAVELARPDVRMVDDTADIMVKAVATSTNGAWSVEVVRMGDANRHPAAVTLPQCRALTPAVAVLAVDEIHRAVEVHKKRRVIAAEDEPVTSTQDWAFGLFGGVAGAADSSGAALVGRAGLSLGTGSRLLELALAAHLPRRQSVSFGVAGAPGSAFDVVNERRLVYGEAAICLPLGRRTSTRLLVCGGARLGREAIEAPRLVRDASGSATYGSAMLSLGVPIAVASRLDLRVVADLAFPWTRNRFVFREVGAGPPTTLYSTPALAGQLRIEGAWRAWGPPEW